MLLWHMKGSIMDIADLEPRKKKEFAIGADLSNHSIEELKELAADLRQEIERIEKAVGDKQGSLKAADAAFKF